MPTPPCTTWRVGTLEVDTVAREVRCEGALLPVGSRAFDVLALLVERGGQPATPQELLARAWPAVVVEPNNLTVQVAALRKLLGPTLIRTLPRRGYQLAEQPVPLRREAATPSAAPTLVVRPLAAHPGSDDAWAAGLTEELVTALGRFRALHVLPAPCGLADAGTPAAAFPGGRFALEGSVRTEGKVRRVVVRLLDAHSRRQLWAEAYRADSGGTLLAQEELAASIASAVQPQVDLAERAGVGQQGDDACAYAIALQAWALLRRHGEADGTSRRELAKTLAQRALSRDPLCSLAARTLAWARSSDLYLVRSAATLAAAQESVQDLTRVLGADPLDHQALHHRGVLHWMAGNSERASDDLHRAHELNPHDSATLAYLGMVEAFCGAPEAGLRYVRAAVKRSPRDPQRYLLHNGLASCLFAAGDTLGCLREARKALSDAPWFPGAWIWVGTAAAALGRADEAVEGVRELQRLAPHMLEIRLQGVWLGSDLEVGERATRFLRRAAGLAGIAPSGDLGLAQSS